MDTESLCVKAGQVAWQIRVDVHVLDDDGCFILLFYTETELEFFIMQDNIEVKGRVFRADDFPCQPICQLI